MRERSCGRTAIFGFMARGPASKRARCLRRRSAKREYDTALGLGCGKHHFQRLRTCAIAVIGIQVYVLTRSSLSVAVAP